MSENMSVRQGGILSYCSGSLNPRIVEPLGKEDAAFKKAVRTVRECSLGLGSLIGAQMTGNLHCFSGSPFALLRPQT